MPRVTGIFEKFQIIDQIPLEEIAKWLKPTPNLIILQNFIANRLLYPQAVPTTREDLEIDLAILREVLKKEARYVNQTTKKIFIPKIFETRFGELVRVVWAFIDAYLPQGMWSVILRGDDFDETVGTLLVPQFEAGGKAEFVINNKSVYVEKGHLLVAPCDRSRCLIKYQIASGLLLNKVKDEVEVFGGRLGVVIDGRR